MFVSDGYESQIFLREVEEKRRNQNEKGRDQYLEVVVIVEFISSRWFDKREFIMRMLQRKIKIIGCFSGSKQLVFYFRSFLWYCCDVLRYVIQETVSISGVGGI